MAKESDLLSAIKTQLNAVAEIAATTSASAEKYKILLNAANQKEREGAKQNYAKLLSAGQKAIENEGQQLGYQAREWKDDTWIGYESTHSDLPRYLRVGHLLAKGQFVSQIAPAMAPLTGGGNMVILASGQGKSEATSFMRSLVLRTLVSYPAGKARFSFIDPYREGKSFSGFSTLVEPVRSKGDILSSPQQINTELEALRAHIRTVNTKYQIGFRYTDIDAYNLQAGELAEPHRFIVIMDFPLNFTSEMANTLLSLAENGAVTGVHVYAMIDRDRELPRDFDLNNLLRRASVFEWSSSSFQWKNPGVERFSFASDTLGEWDKMPMLATIDRIIDCVNTASKSAAAVQVPFAKVISKDLWANTSITGLRAPIGRQGATNFQHIEMGEFDKRFTDPRSAQFPKSPDRNYHAMVAGNIGMGKSIFLNTVIGSLAQSYSPEEIEFYLIDMKGGVGFKDYAVRKFPHARVISANSDREFALSVLEGLVAEHKRREGLFTDLTRRGTPCTKIEEYRTISGLKLPRCVLVVDELTILFLYDDNISRSANRALEQIVKLGRATGIHAIISTQTFRGMDIDKTVLDQIGLRISFQTSEADSFSNLGQDNAAASLLERPGEAYYNDKSGRVEGNALFQAAYFPPTAVASFLDAQASTWDDYRAKNNLSNWREQVVFDGLEPGHLQGNPIWISMAQGNLPRNLGGPTLWLGEPITIKPHTSAVLRRQSQNHVLILSKNEEHSFESLGGGFLSLAAQYPQGSCDFVLINFGEPGSTQALELEKIFTSTAHQTHYAGLNARDLRSKFKLVYEELKRRLSEELTNEPPIFIFFGGMQRAKELRESGSGGSILSRRSSSRLDAPEDEFNLKQAFLEIVAEGPEVGIFIISTVDTTDFLKRIDYDLLKQFAVRVGLPPFSTDDARDVFDSEKLASMDARRGVLIDEEHPGMMEIFKPYQIFGDEVLAGYLSHLGE